MNRTIKFRGKRIDNGQWVYGFLAEDYYINDVNSEDFPSIEIAPETVGQFTGLLDKNEREIYEGDIIKANHKYDDVLPNGAINPDQDCMCIGEVKFSDEFMAFFLRIEKAEYPISSEIGFYNECLIFLHDFDWCGDSAEVLGNVNDHPELLS